VIEVFRRPIFSKPQIRIQNNQIYLKCDFADKDKAKEIPGYRWDREQKCWVYPLSLEVYKQICEHFPDVEADNVTNAILNDMIARAHYVTKAKLAGWEKVEPLKPMPVKVKPFRHQILGYNIGITLPNVALLMEMGTGKSLTALAIAGRRYLDGQIKKLLIVCPTSIMFVWHDEFEKFANFPYSLLVLDGPVQKRIERLQEFKGEGLQVAVINYESVWRMEDELRRWEPDMIISDESQRIKTPSAQQSKAMHRLGKIAKYRMILTGTPVTQGPLDFFSQYKFLDPTIFGNSFYAFRARYAVMGGYENRQVVRYQNLPELIEKAHSIAFRVTKAEALDLPEQIDQIRYCELEPKATRIYEQMRRECIAELENEKVVTAANVLSKLLRLQQITGGFLGDGEGGVQKVSNAKLDVLREILEDIVIDNGKKVVIFARFRPEIAAIEKLLTDMALHYGTITGDTPMKERGEKVHAFQTGASINVFVAQLQTAGLGITLSAADTAVFYSLDFSFANYDQARARLHRIGQKNNVTNIHIIAKGTVDEKVMKALAKKKNLADLVVDGWRQVFEP
jgi:SNF2 family DNA or RNA helicase